MIRKNNAKIISFTGYSGSGKTTLICKVVAELKRRGHSVALIKHDAHDFDIDVEGKDTWKYTQAGADIVGIFSKSKAAIYGAADFMMPCTFSKENPQDGDALSELIRVMPENYDILIVEGARGSGVPKIGVSRKATGKGLSLKEDELCAVVTDEEKIRHENKFTLDDFSGVADFIEKGCFEAKGARQEGCAEENSNSGAPVSESPEKEDAGFEKSVTVERALELLDMIPLKPEPEDIPIDSAYGRITAASYEAETDFPPFARSPLDGYAFRAEDTKGAGEDNPVTFKITEEIPAGKSPEFNITSGLAAKILTGAPVPMGADVVERFEDCSFTDSDVTVFKEYKPDTNIVPKGEDYKAGDVLVKENKKIDQFDIAVLGMLGKDPVRVYKKPVAAFLSTGSELREVSVSKLEPGQIRNSSVYTLGVAAEMCTAEVINAGIVPDDTLKIAGAIKKAYRYSDIVFTTGGVSVGDYDLVLKALELLNAKILFWKVRIKPGMAAVAAIVEGKPFIGLSGNPSSAAMVMDLLGRFLLRKMAGYAKTEQMPQKFTLRLKGEINKKNPRGRHVRGKLLIEEGCAYFAAGFPGANGVTSKNQGTDLIAYIAPGIDRMSDGDMLEAYYVG